MGGVCLQELAAVSSQGKYSFTPPPVVGSYYLTSQVPGACEAGEVLQAFCSPLLRKTFLPLLRVWQQNCVSKGLCKRYNIEPALPPHYRRNHPTIVEKATLLVVAGILVQVDVIGSRSGSTRNAVSLTAALAAALSWWFGLG